MLVAGKYSFNNGEAFIEENYPTLLKEVITSINNVDASEHKNKKSKENNKLQNMIADLKSKNDELEYQIRSINEKLNKNNSFGGIKSWKIDEIGKKECVF